MKPTRKTETLRRGAAILSVFLAIGARALAASPPTPAPTPFRLEPVGAGVYAAIDGPTGLAGSNAGVIVGDEGVLVVDSFYSPDAARRLLAEIRRLTPKPVRYVVNTHYHVDHVGGDAVFREAGAVIIAHRNVPGWIHTENLHLFDGRLTPDEKALVDSLVTPDLVTSDPLTIRLGARRVEIRPVSGHTGGDLIVSVPDAKVVFCGDMLWRRVSPNLIDGTVSQWIATVDALRTAPDAASTTFIPGHGDVARVADVVEFEDYLKDLTAFTQTARSDGKSGEALISAVLPPMKARYGAWDAFGYFAPKEIGFMDAELGGTKRTPRPVAD